MVRCRCGANVGAVRLAREQRRAGVKTRDERVNASVAKKKVVKCKRSSAEVLQSKEAIHGQMYDIARIMDVIEVAITHSS